MLLLSSFDDYLRFLKHEQGVTLTTYKAYHAALYAFHRWLTENGYPEPMLSDFSAASVRRWFYAVSERGLRPRTVHGYLIPLRSFGAFLITQGVLTENPACTVRLPKKDAAIRRETSEEEVTRLLEAVERQRNPRKVALQRAVMCVLIYTGLRRAEVCDLLLADCDLSGGWLLVRSGKGQKSRKVPLCSEAKDALSAWVAVRPDCPHPYLFSVGVRRRLFFEGLRSVVEEVKHLAGLADKDYITPHSLRHSCATRLMRNGASLHDVMTWLGHTQLSTTQRYLHTSEERLQDIANLALQKRSQIEQEPAQGKILRLPQGERERGKLRRRAV